MVSDVGQGEDPACAADLRRAIGIRRDQRSDFLRLALLVIPMGGSENSYTAFVAIDLRQAERSKGLRIYGNSS
jgi:hypothetical protein